MSEYGLCEASYRLGSVTARVPKRTKGEYYNKYFSKSHYEAPKQAAIKWRDMIGEQEWGEKQWAMILFTRRVEPFRIDSDAFVTRILNPQQPHSWVIVWNQSGIKRSRTFIPECPLSFIKE